MTTTDDDIDFDFSSGGLAAQEQAKAEREARKAARGTRTYLTSILNEDGATCLVRFVTDEPPGGPNGANIYVNQHYVPTKGAPKGKPKESDWPDRAGAVCRYTKVGPKNNQRSAYNDCYICDIMRDNKGKKYSNGQRGWAIAVIRKEVVGTQEMVDQGLIPEQKLGVVVGYTDDTIEADEIGPDDKPTGNKVQKKNYVIVNLGLKNFWNGILAFYKRYGTLLDRDYEITRSGEGTDTDYKAVPLDVIQKNVLDENGQPTGQKEPFDLRDEKYAALYNDHGIDLKKIIVRQMSKAHYDRYFDPRVEVDWEQENSDDTPSAASGGTRAAANPDSATAAPTGANADKLAKMKANLLSGNPTAASASTGMVDFS